MIIAIAQVLNAEERERLRALLARVRFVDGKTTAGWHARLVKHNTQAAGDQAVDEAQQLVLEAMRRHPLLQIAARPRRIHPPLFSRYQPGMEYGLHVDDAIMGGDPPLRTDLAATLFLSDPEDYEGGELLTDTTAGEERYKLDAGDMIVYPASTLHRVVPVSRGERLAAVTWIQSLIRDPAQRELLFDLDTTRRQLFERDGKSEAFDRISKSLANLMRMWAET